MCWSLNKQAVIPIFKKKNKEILKNVVHLSKFDNLVSFELGQLMLEQAYSIDQQGYTLRVMTRAEVGPDI